MRLYFTCILLFTIVVTEHVTNTLRGSRIQKRSPNNGPRTSESGGWWRTRPKYSLPNGATHYYVRGQPVYSTPNSYLIINNHNYYWNLESYKPEPSRPFVCHVKFDEKNEIFEDVYLLDEAIYTSLTESPEQKDNGRYRPKQIVYACETNEYCCNGGCCASIRKFWLILICVAVALVLLFACMYLYQVYRNRKDEENAMMLQAVLNPDPDAPDIAYDTKLYQSGPPGYVEVPTSE